MQSINPFTDQIMSEYREYSSSKVEEITFEDKSIFYTPNAIATVFIPIVSEEISAVVIKAKKGS